MRKIMHPDTIEIEHEVRSAKGFGTIKARLLYDAPCLCGCRTPGGWTLDFASIREKDGSVSFLESEQFIKRFGYGAICDVEDHAERASREEAEGDVDRLEEY